MMMNVTKESLSWLRTVGVYLSYWGVDLKPGKKISQFLLTLTAYFDPVPKPKQNTRETQTYKWKCEIRFK